MSFRKIINGQSASTGLARVSEIAQIAATTQAQATAISARQPLITGAATTVVDSNLFTNRALISNGSGKIAVSNTTSTQIDFLSTVSSNIQTQFTGKANTSHTHGIGDVTNLQTSLDGKANLSGGVFTGDITIQRQFPGLELKSTGGGFPYIDFADSTADDFDVRIAQAAGERRVFIETPANVGVPIDAPALRNIRISTSTPSGGSDGDVWLRFTA